MSKKYKVGKIMLVKAAEILHKHGLAVVVTDGEYVQIGKDKK